MNILIIGGTKFLGRHLIDAALKNNHKVTLFNRGRNYSEDEIEDIEQIHGDRNFDLAEIGNRNWDSVIDTCGYLPQTVKASAEFFKDKVNQYVFISSGSVYTNTRRANYDETTATKTLDAEQQKEVEKIDPKGELNGLVLGENYGALKVLCEKAAENAMPNRVLSVRAGMIVGKFDWTDRFAYWVMRVKKGGKILAPGVPENFVQLINARDLSDWIIKMIEENVTGTFNVTSKSLDLTFGKMLDEIKIATESDAEFVWANENFLHENNVAPWSEMPFYLPESDETLRNFLTMNVDKALAKNLKFRPLNDTITEVLDWRENQDFEMKAGISDEREKQLLKQISSRQRYF